MTKIHSEKNHTIFKASHAERVWDSLSKLIAAAAIKTPILFLSLDFEFPFCTQATHKSNSEKKSSVKKAAKFNENERLRIESVGWSVRRMRFTLEWLFGCLLGKFVGWDIADEAWKEAHKHFFIQKLFLLTKTKKFRQQNVRRMLQSTNKKERKVYINLISMSILCTVLPCVAAIPHFYSLMLFWFGSQLDECVHYNFMGLCWDRREVRQLSGLVFWGW